MRGKELLEVVVELVVVRRVARLEVLGEVVDSWLKMAYIAVDVDPSGLELGLHFSRRPSPCPPLRPLLAIGRLLLRLRGLPLVVPGLPLCSCQAWASASPELLFRHQVQNR